MLHVPGIGQAILPVRVEDVPVEEMPAMLRPLIFCDVFGMDAEEARRVLLVAVTGPRRPDIEPVFPGPGHTRSWPGSAAQSRISRAASSGS